MERAVYWKRWTLLAAILASGCVGADTDPDELIDPIGADSALLDAGGALAEGGMQHGSTPTVDAGSSAFDAGRTDAGAARDAGAPAPADSAQPAMDAAPAGDGGARADGGGSLSFDPNGCSVQPIPDDLRTSYKMGAIYKRYASASGVPVIASEKPPDETVKRACLLIQDYATVSEKIQAEMVKRKVRFIVMAKSEKTDINRREELRTKDEKLYALLSEVLKDKPEYKDCYYYGP